MISILITIVSLVGLIAGVAYALYEYVPYVVGIYNSVTYTVQGFIAMFPEWLAPFAVLALAIAVISLLVKVI